MLHHRCVLGGPAARGQSQRWPKSGHTCYVTPAFSGVPFKRGRKQNGPQKGRSATSPLCSRGSPNKGKRLKVAHRWAEVLRRPCVLQGPQKTGQSQRWPTSGWKCYVTTAFLAGPVQKGTETKGAQKRAEVLHHPCVLRGPQTSGQSQGWPTRGQSRHPFVLRGPLQKGTKIEVAHKKADVLHHPCVLGGPPTDQKLVKNGSKMCFSKDTFALFGVHKQVNSAHFEPRLSNLAPPPPQGCTGLENGPIRDHKWLKNESKPWYSKNDPCQFVLPKWRNRAHFEPLLSRSHPLSNAYLICR